MSEMHNLVSTLTAMYGKTGQELPDELEINGVKYRRVDDIENDSAVELLRRIKTVAQGAGTTMAQAAWAINSQLPAFPVQ